MSDPAPREVKASRIPRVKLRLDGDKLVLRITFSIVKHMKYPRHPLYGNTSA
jgi:hypothetical protein